MKDLPAIFTQPKLPNLDPVSLRLQRYALRALLSGLP
jgi:hypothetical protein